MSLLATGAWVGWVLYAYPNVPPPAPVKAKASPQTIGPGAYLFNNVARCVDCHSTRDWSKYAAPVVPGTEAKGGVVRAPNITPDADTGVGTWSEQQFVTRFKVWERVPDRVLPASQRRANRVMPWKQLGGMTRDDLGAVYAFLRAQRPVIHRVVKRDRDAAASTR